MWIKKYKLISILKKYKASDGYFVCVILSSKTYQMQKLGWSKMSNQVLYLVFNCGGVIICVYCAWFKQFT